MAHFTCDNKDCFLFEKERLFEYGFSCAHSGQNDAPCAARELTVAASVSTQRGPSGDVGSWGLDRRRPAPDDERPTEVMDRSGRPVAARGGAAVIVPWVLVVLMLIGGGLYAFREPLSATVGIKAPFSGTATSDDGLAEERLFAALLAAGYSREISDKILSVRRQVDTIRERNEASTPELLKQLADVEVKIKQNEVERRAAFAHYLQSVEQLGKQPVGDVESAEARLLDRLDEARLSRLKALLPVLQGQIEDARAGKIDHDRWISQIEVAPI